MVSHTAPEILGTGHNTAAIFSRDGRDRLLPLGGVSTNDQTEGISELQWDRRHSDFSAGFIQLTGTPAGLRDSQLRQIHAWAHSLVMFRDGRRCWEGPITDIDETAEGLRFDAVDVSGWTNRRAIRRKRKTKKKQTVSVIDEMSLDVRRAFFPDNPNVTSHLQVFHDTDEAHTARDVAAYSGYYGDDLKTLCEDGGNFTTIGRSIVIWPDQHVLGKLRSLDADAYIIGTLHVREVGGTLWTLTTAINQKGKTATRRALNTSDTDGDVNGGGVSKFYGLHHRRFDAPGTKTRAALASRARRQENRHYPVQTVITVDDNAQLSPKTPLGIEQLVAGITVPVSTRLRGDLLRQTLILESVTVNQKAEGETVGVTFTNPAVDLNDVSSS
jgi:hypothetical protein